MNDIGEYEIIAELNEGTYGKVYKVKSKKDEQILALKLLKFCGNVDDEIKKRFKLEFETAQIKSNYLVHSKEFGNTNDDKLYFTMEFCPCGNLRQKIGKGLEKNKIEEIGIRILMGLNDLHKNGKVHRDLKPENIVFDDNDLSKLTDFGIAGHLILSRRMTDGKTILGTRGYMSPEQLKSELEKTILWTTDIFSFGVIMFELFTGQLPFGKLEEEKDLIEYEIRLCKGEYDEKIMNQISDPWKNIIKKCLIANCYVRERNVDNILKHLGKEVIEKISYNPENDKLTLKIMHGEKPGIEYKLNDLISEENGLITIGRDDPYIHNMIRIVEEQSCFISRRHATIEKYSNRCYITDGQWFTSKMKNEDKKSGSIEWKNNENEWIGSRNGTYVNSKMIKPMDRIELKPNDIITIGDTTFKVIVNSMRIT